MTQAGILRGSVIKFFEDRDYGFIRPSDDDGEDDVFFHLTAVLDGKVPKHGALVEYQIEERKGRRRAVNVKYASAPHEQAAVRFGEK